MENKNALMLKEAKQGVQKEETNWPDKNQHRESRKLSGELIIKAAVDGCTTSQGPACPYLPLSAKQWSNSQSISYYLQFLLPSIFLITPSFCEAVLPFPYDSFTAARVPQQSSLSVCSVLYLKPMKNFSLAPLALPAHALLWDGQRLCSCCLLFKPLSSESLPMGFCLEDIRSLKFTFFSCSGLFGLFSYNLQRDKSFHVCSHSHLNQPLPFCQPDSFFAL